MQIECDKKNICFYAKEKVANFEDKCADCSQNKKSVNPIKDYSKQIQEQGY